jgi:hypothetical protein
MLCASATAGLSAAVLADTAAPASAGGGFEVAEAGIADIQSALLSKRVTTVQVVRAYLARIKAYNGTCVKQPQGILGVIEPIPNAGQINALMTLNLRPASRKQMGFDDRKARSMTDAKDADANMPDALEIAAAQDRQLKRRLGSLRRGEPRYLLDGRGDRRLDPAPCTLRATRAP